MNAYHEKIFNTIVERIEQNNELPWQCPYVKEGLPYNYTTGKHYSGGNLLSLWCGHYNRGGFLTYLQAQKLGAHVRKGEKGLPILYAQNGGIIEQEDGSKKLIKGCARVYWVYNVSQIDDLPNVEHEHSGTNADVNLFLESLPIVWNEGHKPAYDIPSDSIEIPYREDFKSDGEYYATAFHELIHWSGAKHRLNRTQSKVQEQYSYEELVAELGSAFLRAQFKIDNPQTTENSAAYIRGWLQYLKTDGEVLFKAMRDAEEAVDYLIEAAVSHKTVAGESQQANA